jgi:hypothetical protein
MSRLSLAPIVIFGAATGLLLAGCGGGGSNNGAAPAVTQKVTGFVWDWDTAAPIVGATVKVQGTNITAVSAADGSYTVGPLNPTRSYNLLISNNGYVSGVVKMLSKNATLQGPDVILVKGNAPTTVQNSAGGPVTSNATLDGNTATVTIPANALPGGAASASVGATLITGTAVPGAASDNTKIAYPVINVAVTGATGNFAQPVTVSMPLPFPMTAAATMPVLMLQPDGSWAPMTPATNATVSQDGKSASFATSAPGTYAFLMSLTASATVANVTTTPIAGPYTDPVEYDLTGTTVNWSATAADSRDALDATFTQGQRQQNINIPGDLDQTKLIIHPRGTAEIDIVKQDLNVTFSSGAFTIQQVTGHGTGTVTNLAYYQIVPHQQGSSSGG